MKASIAVFNSHKDAVNSTVLLNKNDFPLSKVSLVGKAEIIDNNIEVNSNEPLINAPVFAGTILGTTLGLLSGVGLFVIPGLGFLYGAGAIIGAIGGFDFGMITGGFATILLRLGIEDEYAVKYNELVKEGKFLMVINGTSEEIENAKRIIGSAHIGHSIHNLKQAA